MKRLVFCLLVLVGVVGMSAVMACGSVANKKAPQGTIQTYVGLYVKDYACECRDENNEYCPQCTPEEINCPDCGPSLAILIDGKIYFVNGAQWEEGLRDLGLKQGEEVSVTGLLFNSFCVDYIDLATIKKMSAAVEDVYVPDGVLNLQQPMYDMLGIPVDKTFRGIVIQNGHKFVRE